MKKNEEHPLKKFAKTKTPTVVHVEANLVDDQFLTKQGEKVYTGCGGEKHPVDIKQA